MALADEGAVPAQRQDGRTGDIVHWFVLVISGVLEAVWATALATSDRFRRPLPTVVFAVALVASMGGLAWAMTGLPTGTSYAVWVGIGAVCTVLLAAARGHERLDARRAALLLLLIGCVVGLRVVS